MAALILPGKRASLRKVMVLSIDGTPHSLIRQRMAANPDSIWHTLTDQAPLHRIRSSRPEVSSVAWASYLTGTTPSHHGIFGFAERTLNPFRLYYPNGSHLRAPTLFERVHEAGGTVVSLNVPATSPAKPLQGVVVGGFLLPRLKGNVQPPYLGAELEQAGYVVDTDPGVAHRDRAVFYQSLVEAHDARVAAGLRFVHEVDWDLFHLHLMETDRLYHFYWGEPDWQDRFDQFLDRVEHTVAQFAAIARDKGAALVLLSDHGFTRSRRILFVNAVLRKTGLLRFQPGQVPSLETIDPSSKAYALPPGRIFLNLRGREPMGSVAPGQDAEQLLASLQALFSDLKDNLTGDTLIDEVVRPAQVDRGPFQQEASDLLLHAKDGIDLKADFSAEQILDTPSILVGTHTYLNAFFHVSNATAPTWTDDEGDVAAAGRFVASLLNLA
ncbi:alkaline phosphatase family protein [bacterium]|nr:alkaline phosphatase family protein [bacterium]